jgi:hypothetical protein
VWSNRKISILLAIATAAPLAAMVAITLNTGAAQEPHEHFALPDVYAARLLEHPAALRWVFALDIGFVILYTAFFAALAGYLRSRGRPFASLALGAMLLVALLDIVEDHHILAMLDGAELGVIPSAWQITFQSVESATKFSVSFVSLVLFGLAIPRDTKLGLALSLFLTVGTIASAITGYASPGTAVDRTRWVGFLAGIVLVIGWLRNQSEEPGARPSIPENEVPF